jgi:hypothetical protein
LWAQRTGSQLALVDDRSLPKRAAEIHRDLVHEGCNFVLGPYGGDSTRAVCQQTDASVIWNHGAAADDVQRLPGVVSVCSPASGYLAALARAVCTLVAKPRIAIVAARGPMGQLARGGLSQVAYNVGAEVVASLSFADTTRAVLEKDPDAVLACGPLPREVELFRSLRPKARGLLIGGISPGLRTFPAHLGENPEGLLGLAQWHPDLGESPGLGPASSEVVDCAQARGLELDYVACQAYACALIAAHCHSFGTDDPGAYARTLETTTFYGAFALDSATGMQTAHRLCVVRWQEGDQKLLLPQA